MQKNKKRIEIFSFLRLIIDRIWVHEANHKIFTNMIWLTADKIIRLGVGLLIGIWMARYLGPERFGLLNYGVAWVGIFGVFSTLGMDGIVVRDLVRYPSERGALMGTNFFLRVVGSIVLVITSTGITLLADHGNGRRQAIVVVIAIAQIFKPLDAIDLWFQAIMKWKNVFIARNLAYLASNALRVIMILRGADTIAFAWVFMADTAFSAIGLFLIGKVSKDQPGSWHIDLRIAKRILKDSWPLALSSIAIILYMRIDQVMIGRMLGNVEVGIYSVAVRISEVWYFVPLAIAQSVFPTLVEMKKNSEESYWRRIQLVCTILVWTGILIGVVFQIAGGWIISFLFGAKFTGAITILKVHIWAGVFVALGVGSGNWYILEDKQKMGMLTTGIAAIMNILLNLLFIPLLGPVGAAIATVLSQMFSTFIVPGIHPGARKLFWIMLWSFVPINGKRGEEEGHTVQQARSAFSGVLTSCARLLT